jgi:hypothetical protein
MSALARARAIVRWAQLALTVLALGGAAYLGWRVELVRLPAAGCSPLLRYAPGALLVVDRRPPHVFARDAVLFEAGETLLLGRVEELGGAADAGRALWIAADDPTCDAKDSDELGWIPRGAVRGRVLFALPL